MLLSSGGFCGDVTKHSTAYGLHIVQLQLAIELRLRDLDIGWNENLYSKENFLAVCESAGLKSQLLRGREWQIMVHSVPGLWGVSDEKIAQSVAKW